MEKDYHIFISHSWTNPEDLDNLKNLLSTRGYSDFVFEEATADIPINSINASYLKGKIKQKILNSNIVLGIAGMDAIYCEWMAWELETANNLDIPIVGVIPWGKERISTTVTKYSKQDVPWNIKSIVEAISKWVL
jgi:hypothetical protein